MTRKSVHPYHQPAGGWGALKALSEALLEQRTPREGRGNAARMNQPQGFDCPGCAWPDPKHTSSFEFCENGGKAVAWEATAKRCTPEFFAAHTVTRARRLERLRARNGRSAHRIRWPMTPHPTAICRWLGRGVRA